MPLSPELTRLLRPCKRKRAANDSGSRAASAVRHVVIHSTEGGTARSVADYFARSTTRASTQLVVDAVTCYRCVPDLVVPWGAPGVNTSGLHVEHCGYAAWTRAQWLARLPMLERSAAKAARWAYRFGIPRKWLTVAQLKAGARGFCTHYDATRAFPPNAGHHDPGSGFPRDVYMRLVRSYFAELQAASENSTKV